MLRAPETEALYEGSVQKGFGFLSIDGSLVPLGSTATHETTGSKLCGSRSKATQNKCMQATLNNHRGTSGRELPA